METIEKTAETVEAAIQAGLEELDAKPSEVMVEVLEEPHPGLMGEGARPARVRLVLMVVRRPQQPAPSPAPTPAETPAPPPPHKKPAQYESGVVDEEDADDVAREGKAVLADLLERMDIDATITIRRAEATRESEELHWVLNIRGPRISRLIGRRGETLSSLQYITRLIVSRRLQKRASLIVDADAYKLRRSERLQQLADRMADQAVRQQRVITLEPMPPNERRIIHLSLRERDDVETKSVGEGKSRKVTIHPL